MKYRAVIIFHKGVMFQWFDTLGEAERWIDSHENDNYSMIEVYEKGRKVGGFFYTEKKR